MIRDARPTHLAAPFILLGTMTLVGGCLADRPAPVAPTKAAAPAPVSGEAALARADAAATRLATTLRQKLVDAMTSGGPARAVDVCAVEAQRLAAQVKIETGVTVGRASLRLRNAANAPPQWVAAWLAAQGERPAEGVAGLMQLAEGPTGPVAIGKRRRRATVLMIVSMRRPSARRDNDAYQTEAGEDGP